MERALELAELGNGYVNPNPQVGAVVVKDGEIVGQGYHEEFGGPHAEVRALEDAGDRTSGGKMYVTLEPCNHHGKTPPCTDAIIESKIKEVYIASRDPNPRVTGGGISKLKQAGIVVKPGLLKDRARKLNEIFFHYINTGLPFVLLKLAMTADGKIATRTGDSRWITSPESRKRVHELRARYSGIGVGVNTALTDDPRLTVRDADGPDGTRFIFDSTGDLPADLNLFSLESDAPTVIVTGRDAKEKDILEYRDRGALVWQVESRNGEVNLNQFLKKMGEEGYDSLMIEGGSKIAWSFLSRSLVDKLNLFIAPKIVGGDSSVPAVGGKGFDRIKDSIGLRDVEVTEVGPDISYIGYPEKP